MDEAERGFSFRKDAPLDMRMGPDVACSAEHLVNTWPESELGQIFREYGEERHWKGIASRYATLHSLSAATAVGGGGGGGGGEDSRVSKCGIVAAGQPAYS